MGRGGARLLYVSFEGLPKTVFDAQVVGFLRAMAARGLIFDLFVFERLGSAWQSRDRNARRLAELRAVWGGRVFHVPFATKHEFPLAVSAFILALAPDLARRRRLVLHCRGLYSALLAALVKQLSRNVFFVYDVRGDTEAEYRYRTSDGNSRLSLRGLELRLLRWAEGVVLRRADYILCVSAALQDRLRIRWRLEGKKSDVVPTCVESALFRFDPEVRFNTRRALGFAGRTVLVYAGSMYPWQRVDQATQLTSRLRTAVPNLHFLCITPDLNEARVVLSRSLPGDAYTLQHVAHAEMPQYLMASDVGVLIRERHPLNEVACPTKFGEYLMCGLPVVVTDGIGDVSDLVRREDLGVVLADPGDPAALRAVLGLLPRVSSLEWRSRIAEVGRRVFSWDQYAPLLQSVYEEAMASAGT